LAYEVPVTGYWRILRNEELHYLYPSPNIIRTKKEMCGAQAYSWDRERERRDAYRVSVGITVGDILKKSRWEDNIKMYIKK
jgi:hypothetical protein